MGSRFPLEISPDPILLGTLFPGRSAIAKLTVRNSGSRPVIVESIETSCPCLNVAKQWARLGPRQTADLTVRFDPADEPDFRGCLSIDVIGREPGGEIAFRTRVEVEVRDHPGESAEGLPSGPDPNLEGGAP